MKISRLVLGIALSASAFAGPLTEGDRGRILSELQASRKLYLDSIANLSPAQWTYKAGPDRWSIQETAEHIIAAEGFLGDLIRKQILVGPADAAKAAQRAPGNAVADEKLLTVMRDRSQKATAPEPIVPKGIYKTPADAAVAFKAARDKTLDFIRTTNDALRDHFAPSQGGELDGVQWMLLLAGHNERHVEQIEEVKQSPGYPK